MVLCVVFVDVITPTIVFPVIIQNPMSSRVINSQFH